jgi:hypothetical protein
MLKHPDIPETNSFDTLEQGMIELTSAFGLFANILLRISASIFSKVIGLKFSFLVVSLLDLNNRAMLI